MRFSSLALFILILSTGCASTQSSNHATTAHNFSMSEFHNAYSEQCEREVQVIDLSEVIYEVQPDWLVIDGRPLPVSCFQVAAFWQKHRLSDTYKPYYGKLAKRIKRLLMEEISQDYILEAEAQRQGITVSSEELNERYISELNQYMELSDMVKDHEELKVLFEQELKRTNESPFYVSHIDQSLEHWKTYTARQVIHEKTYAIKEIQDEEVQEHYATHLSDYTPPDKPILEIIFLQYNTKETPSETMARAQKIHATLLESPEEFTQLATRHSDPYIDAHIMKDPTPGIEYNEAVDALEHHAISAPIAIDRLGVYLFSHQGMIKGKPSPFEEVQTEIYNTMTTSRIKVSKEALLKALHAKHLIEPDLSKITFTLVKDDTYGMP